MTSPFWNSDASADEQLAAVIQRELERHLEADKGWKPLPHQVPPPLNEDWMGWLLLAGRGAGKTDACSHFVVDHVNGPPCIDGPVPHWMAIIAPTLGDAATACYSGPSGIRRHSPEAVMSQKVGGLLVSWPNGSQAKMYGARDPDDIERLRAGGNTSVIMNAMIRTARGQVPIQDVRVGDQVWTRNGLRRVLMSDQTGVKPVVRLRTAAGRELELTVDHEVWTERGWIEAGDLLPGDTLTTWSTSSSTTAHAGTVASAPGTTPTRVGRHRCCTATSGPEKSGRSRLATSSITGSPTTRRPLTSTDSSASAVTAIMSASTTNLATTGTVLEASRPGKIASRSRSSAATATARSGLARTATGSAVLTASVPATNAATFQVVHERGACALCAALRSRPLPVSAPALAHDHVVSVCADSAERVAVYDLLVEDDHEFFANDVLVANCLVWMEELAAWRYLKEAWDQMRFGLRLGTKPRWIASTTPKPRDLIKEMKAGKYAKVVVRHATMYENPHLPDHIKEALEEAYTGTATGSQELYGQLVEQDENALFTRENLSANRVTIAPPLSKIVVGVDPSGGSGEQGIVVEGMQTVMDENRRPQRHGYVLHDATVRTTPEGWAKKAVTTAVDWDADCIVVETNFGGDMAVSTINAAAEHEGIAIPVRTVHASRGKMPRAQPVSALAVQGRFHMVGVHELLEDQLCTWTTESKYSPDRLDAMVWPAWYMKLVSTIYRSVGTFGGAAMANRSLGRRRSA